MVISSPSNGSSGVRFSPEQLNRALLALYDLMTRDPNLGLGFIVVGEAGRCLYENRGLDCRVIEIVASRRMATPEVLSMLKVWASSKADRDGAEWTMEGVPIRFRFVGDYDHFKFADSRIYGPEFYKIPNQFKDYWERREEFV